MAHPGFDPIGPFDFRRSDQFVAAVYIGLVLGRGAGKFLSYLILSVSALLLVAGVVLGDFSHIIFGLLFPLMIFVILPALRSNRRNRDIVVTGGVEGLQIETGQVRSIYRWAQVEPVRVFAERLFVMIDANCGLIIPLRATDPENFRRFADTCQTFTGEIS